MSLSFRLGELELTSLRDGYFRLDGGAMFGVVPKPLWEKRAPADERNRIALAMRPLLVTAVGGGPRMIIDAGCGNKMDAKSTDIYAIDRGHSLPDALREVGLAMESIEIALASHLHFDHAGGFTTRHEDGRVRPAFPRARYIVRTGEWEDATHPHERNRASYLQEDFVPLAEAGVLDLVEGDGEIMPGVRVQWTGGHARNHQVIFLESAGRTAVFAADMIPTTAHVDDAWIMGYDLYPMETLAFKRTFIREAIDREYLIFFEHDPHVAAGYIRQGRDGKKFVEPVLSD